MTAAELAEKLTVIADKAKALRDAGVIGRVDVDDVSFEIGEAVMPEAPTHNAPPANSFDDPDSYPGGFVPQRRVPVPDPTPTAVDEDDD